MTAHRTTIDLNGDLGESDAPDPLAADDALLHVVSSANIACGGHAGDPASMTRTIRSAVKRGVAVGAHPSYPDRAGFGRVEMEMTPDEVEQATRNQLAALDRIAATLGARIAHVKPHGALYHAAMTKPEIAKAIARAAARLAARPALIGLAGSASLEAWRGMGFNVSAEAFADRRYEPDGSLRSRKHDDSLITDPTEAAAQAVRIAQGSGPVAIDGSIVPLHADTICIHSDTPCAVSVARAVRSGLERAGFTIRSIDTGGAAYP